MMRKLLLLLIVLLSVTCQGQIKFSREPSTNAAHNADFLLIDNWLGGTGFRTARIALTNFLSTMSLIQSNALTNVVTLTSNALYTTITTQASNGVTVAAGSANVTVTTNSSGSRMVYTIDTSGSGGGIATLDGLGTNTTLKASTSTKVPLIVQGASSQTTNLFQVKDSSGNILGVVKTDGRYYSQYDFGPFTLQTTDNTTNTIVTITMTDNSAVRVIANVTGYNSTSSATYGKVGSFKSVAGTVTQVGGTATLGSGEDDAAFEAIIDTTANTIRVRVAGNTGKTVNWTTWVNLYYSQ